MRPDTYTMLYSCYSGVFLFGNNITLMYPFFYRPTLTIMRFLVQTASHWSNHSTIDKPLQVCVFLFRRYNTEVPVLLSTYLDNRAFSFSDNITLKYLFYLRPNLTVVYFLVQTTSHWNTRSTIDQVWQSCVLLFRRHNTEVPVLLSTDLDNCAFSCSDDITLKYPFYYQPNITIMCFLVQTT